MNPATPGPIIEKWTWTRWLAAIAIVFAIHVALIFIFDRGKPSPRAVKDVPSLTLVGESSVNWIALNNATLFALPDHDGFAGLMWIDLPPLPFHQQDWTEKPRWLAVTDSVPAAGFGVTFNQFAQTNQFAGVHFEYNLPPEVVAPAGPVQPPFAQNSTLQVRGEIAKRHLLTAMNLPSWPSSDVIAPSIVQVLVDAAGNVVSATLLPPENFLEALEPLDVTPEAKPVADQRAVELARSVRFAPLRSGDGQNLNPLSRLAIGQLIFNWQTMPATGTNEFE